MENNLLIYKHGHPLRRGGMDKKALDTFELICEKMLESFASGQPFTLSASKTNREAIEEAVRNLKNRRAQYKKAFENGGARRKPDSQVSPAALRMRKMRERRGLVSRANPTKEVD